jgi:hypothetical protein
MEDAVPAPLLVNFENNESSGTAGASIGESEDNDTVSPQLENITENSSTNS